MRLWIAITGLVCLTCLIACSDDIAIGTAESSGGGGSTATANDDDADGLSNSVEETFATKPTTADSDSDGFDDGLEFVGLTGDPLNPSASPSPFNRAKILPAGTAAANDPDSDQDGLGDKFETDNALSSDNADTDEDGFQDGLELVANSNPFDSESRPTRTSAPTSGGAVVTDPPPSDSDSDGLADNIEALNGTTSTSRDSDADGFSDGIEFLMGSDGGDALSVPNFTVPAPPAT